MLNNIRIGIGSPCQSQPLKTGFVKEAAAEEYPEAKTVLVCLESGFP
jgi:hypothetical protein